MRSRACSACCSQPFCLPPPSAFLGVPDLNVTCTFFHLYALPTLWSVAGLIGRRGATAPAPARRVHTSLLGSHGGSHGQTQAEAGSPIDAPAAGTAKLKLSEPRVSAARRESIHPSSLDVVSVGGGASKIHLEERYSNSRGRKWRGRVGIWEDD